MSRTLTAVTAASALTWVVLLAVEWRAVVAPTGFVRLLVGWIAMPSLWLLPAVWLAAGAPRRARLAVAAVVLYTAGLNGLNFAVWLRARRLMPTPWPDWLDAGVTNWLLVTLMPWTFWPATLAAGVPAAVGWWRRPGTNPDGGRACD